MKEKPRRRYWLLLWIISVVFLLCYHSSNVHEWLRARTELDSSSSSSIIATDFKISSSNVMNSTDYSSYFDGGSAEDEQTARNGSCASVEEMGRSAGGGTSTREADLRIRDLIQRYILDHGAQHVRTLDGAEFCKRGFVLGKAQEDGFGNEMYKLLSAAGLGLMLNRSLIIGEDSSTNPAYLGLNGNVHRAFGDYLLYSDEAFTMREVKRLWVVHDCDGKHGRRLNVRVDHLRPAETDSLCGDWTSWSWPIIWFSGAQDPVALQLFLKNVNPRMRTLATRVLGDPEDEASGGNVFGELMRVFIKPMPVIEDAVQWTLGGGPDPDVALHLRMRNSRSRLAIQAACSCVQRALKQLKSQENRHFRVVVVTDTPNVVSMISDQLKTSAEVVFFDYHEYIGSFDGGGSDILKNDLFQPPKKRIRDWGPLPRWVALVDFYLASRAKYGVISGASKRIATTYAQLLASLAASNSIGNDFKFYSSFHSGSLLRVQNGWGHAWRTFSGAASCRNQAYQCALTPLLPHAWWDKSPWQVPTKRDVRSWRSFGIHLNVTSGSVSESELLKWCKTRRRPKTAILRLELPLRQKLSI